ncbi:MAG: hypothetical protein R3E53_08275 [Myxococcota bacterium]
MDARSIITTPAFPEHVEPGWREIRGLAWSGRGRIVRVEVSVDGGADGGGASGRSVLPKAHTRFAWPGGMRAAGRSSPAVRRTRRATCSRRDAS